MKLFPRHATPSWLFPFLLVTAFILPLIFNPWGYDIFEFPKNLWLKNMILLMVAGLVIEWLRGRWKVLHLSVRHQVVLSLFLFILAFSLVVSLLPEISFWGDYVRQGGVINMLYYGLLFVLGLQVFNEEINRERFLKVTMGAGILVAILALLQKLGLHFFSQAAVDAFAGRSYSSLGNPTSLGAFLLFPIAAFFALKASSETAPRYWILVLLLAGVVAAENRASLLAIGACSGLYLLWLSRKKPIFFWSLLVIGIAGVVTGFALYGEEVRSLLSRLSIWQSSALMLKDHWLLGVGPENFIYLFDLYVQPELFFYEDYMTSIDRPHNEFLEWWIHYGLLGVLFYLGLVGAILKEFWTTARTQKRFVALGLLALVFSNLFSFSLVTHFAYAALFLALLFPSKEKMSLKGPAYLRWSFGLLLLFLMGGLLTLNGHAFLQDRQIKQAYVHVGEGNYEVAVDSLLSAHRSDFPYVQPYADSFVLSYGLAQLAETAPLLAMSEYFASKEASVSYYALKPSLHLARYHQFVGQNEDAEAVYELLYKTGRRHPLLFEQWGGFHVQQGKMESAALIYDEFFKWMPDTWKQSYPDAEATRVFWKNHPSFDDTIRSAALAYEAVGREEEALELIHELAP